MLKLIFRALTLVGVLGAATAVAEERQRYDVYGSGLKLGTLGMNYNISGERYGVSGRVADGGLLGAFVKFDFSGTAEGTIASDGTLRPTRYSGTDDNGKRKRTVSFNFRSATPQTVSFSPARTPKPIDVSPSTQRGTVDPISATFSLLRDQPVGKACGKTVEVFDGSKRSRLRLAKRQPTNDGLFVCNGTYSRVKGFSAKLMAKQVNFPFSIIWREQDGIMEVVRFQTQTTFGTVSAIRR